ncbi:MAG: hypothetical protein COB98_09920 [Flavobacteriaceae bacterium]|nr:MAG: hypothetical protein COB98_09920 [Flavobacteriaceae bacterium]
MKQYKWRSVVFVIFFSLNISQVKSEIIDCVECKTRFSVLGISDFKLYSDKEDVLKRFPQIKQVFLKRVYDDSKVFYVLKQIVPIYGVNRKINYKLTFKDDKLVIVYFELDLENNYELFFSLRDEIIDENKNTYINAASLLKNKYSFQEVKKGCKKFFRIKHLGKNIYLVGGISSPPPSKSK